MTIIFWICWIIELGLVFWWLFQDIKLTHKDLNPFIILSFLYLGVVMLVRFVLGWTSLSGSMVLLPAIPLLGLGLIIGIAMTSKSRWN